MISILLNHKKVSKGSFNGQMGHNAVYTVFYVKNIIIITRFKTVLLLQKDFVCSVN